MFTNKKKTKNHQNPYNLNYSTYPDQSQLQIPSVLYVTISKSSIITFFNFPDQTMHFLF